MAVYNHKTPEWHLINSLYTGIGRHLVGHTIYEFLNSMKCYSSSNPRGLEAVQETICYLDRWLQDASSVQKIS